MHQNSGHHDSCRVVLTKKTKNKGPMVTYMQRPHVGEESFSPPNVRSCHGSVVNSKGSLISLLILRVDVRCPQVKNSMLEKNFKRSCFLCLICCCCCVFVAEIELNEAGQGIHETSCYRIAIQRMHPRGRSHASRGAICFSSSSGLSLSIYFFFFNICIHPSIHL